MDFHPDTLLRLRQLQEKYAVMGQDLNSYLDGLLYADYLTYWDYIHLDTLLSLQNPKTSFPDEQIFIVYHQVTELYFKLILQAIQRVTGTDPAQEGAAALLQRQLKRVNAYFGHLVHSFDIMVDGMDKEEFLKFRMSLLPASGFQSAQYRSIEIASTDFYLLTEASVRSTLDPDADPAALYQYLYWRRGATELATGKQTLTLRRFEERYAAMFREQAMQYRVCNLRRWWLRLPEADRYAPELLALLREHDLNANVRWNLMHYRSAVRYLDRKPREISATGGTNWQQYLPPKNQRIVFYPDIWSDEELENWGRTLGV